MTAGRLAIGTMTGTSLDALDAALVRAEGEGTEMRAGLVRFGSFGLGELGARLRRLATGRPMPASEIAACALELGQLHAHAVMNIAAEDTGALSLVAIHGQTVYHGPPVSWQLINPHPVAALSGAPVVFDMRQADLMAGGQGAPITPIADRVLFAGVAGPSAVVNLGGFCNITTIGRDETAGRDVCACNQLLDALARELLNRSYDPDGENASRGWEREALVRTLEDLLGEQSSSGRSLGTGDELEAWARRARDLDHPTDDILASACGAIASVVTSAAGDAETLVLAGGGVRNAAIVRAITRRSSASVVRSGDLGVPEEQREAMAMAVLGLLCADRVPITLPAVTGREPGAIISGAWVLP